MTAYSPLGSGDRNEAMKAPDEPLIMEDAVIKQIADKHGYSPAQVLLAWAVNRGTTVIPKSTNPGRLKQNYDAQFIELDQVDMSAIDHIDHTYRFVNGKFWTPAGGPYTMEYLWGTDS
jgi:alcohol dehydrogenase (NADP+)